VASSFTPEQVESATPDEWTGKPTAIVYTTTAEAAAWLTLRGLSAFSGSTEPLQDTALLNATEEAEAYILPKIAGKPIQTGQRLYLPALGAYDEHMNLLSTFAADLATNRSVARYLEGIYLIAEKMRAGTWRTATGTGASSKKRRKTTTYEVEYHDGADPEGLGEQHRDVEVKLLAIVPGII